MKKEELLYFIIWIGAILLGLKSFSYACKNHHNVSPSDFAKGYQVLGNRMKDNSDAEWTILTSFFKRFWLLYLFEILGCQLILRTNANPQVLPIYFASYSVFSLVVILGFAATSIFILFLCIIFITSCCGKKIPVYLITFSTLVFIQNSNFVVHFLDASAETFLFDVALSWLLAKSLSFAVDRIEANVHKSITFADVAAILAYSLYLPTMFTGPIITYSRFNGQMLNNAPLLPQEILKGICQLFYILLLYFIYEFLLHFVFSSAIQFYPEIVSSYDGFALCGLGYALPMMFYFKYFILYGLSGALAQLEGFELPPPPKCISCIHLSSFLWRHFDRGLYLWLLKYLYLPIINKKYNSLRKIFSLCLCFCFMVVWHRLELPILVSCAMNCLLLSSEIAMHNVSNSKIGKFFEKIPVIHQKRLKAAIATPHFLMMCISCAFFLSNCEIGMLLIKRIVMGGVTPLIPVLLVMYSGCHVSMNLKPWQEKNIYV